VKWSQAHDYYHDEEGHFKKDNPKRKKDMMRDEKSSTMIVVARFKLVYERDLFLAVAESLKKSYWTLDSSCSFHMCSIRKHFAIYQTCNRGAVKMANDARSRIYRDRGSIVSLSYW